MIIWLTVVILALTGRRRAAAAIAIAPLALDLTSLLAGLIQRTGAWSGGLPMFLYTTGAGPVVLASLSACSLAFSAGPRRGLAIAGKRRACLMVAGLAAAFGFPALVLLVSPFMSWPDYTWNILGTLAVAAAVIATCARGPAGGRVAVLVAAGPLAGLAGSLPFLSAVAATVVSMLPSLLIAVLVWPVAIASWKGTVSRA
jgi:hypothetical protein